MTLLRSKWTGRMGLFLLSCLAVVVGAAGPPPVTKGVTTTASSPLDPIRDALRQAVAKGAVEHPKLIASLDGVIRALDAGDTPEVAEAYALRGALLAQKGELTRAINDLSEAVERDADERLIVQLPIRITAGSGPETLALQARPVGELLYEALADAGQVRPFQLRRARPFVSLARKAAQRNPTTNRPELLEMYDRDEALIDILISADSDELMAARLLEAVLEWDSQTGRILVRDSKGVPQALIRSAEILDRFAPKTPTVDSPRLRAIVERLRLSPIQITQLALALESATETSRRRGLTLLQRQYERIKAKRPADQVRRLIQTVRQDDVESPADRAFHALLVGRGDPMASLEALTARRVDRTALDLVRAETNPVYVGTVQVRSPGLAVNVLQSRPATAGIPAAPDLADEMACYAARALALWEVASGPARAANAPEPADEALSLGADLASLLQARVRGPAPVLHADAPENFARLLDVKRKLLKVGTSPRDVRFDGFARLVDLLARTGLLEGRPGARNDVLEVFRHIRLNENAPALRSRRLMEPLCRSLIRHGLFAEAAACHDALAKLDGPQANEPTTMLLHAQLMRRRRGERDGANETEKAAAELFRQRLAVTDPTGADVRAALSALAGLTSATFREPVRKAIEPTLRVSRYRSVVLGALAGERLPGFDAYLAEQVRRSAAGFHDAGAGWHATESWEDVVAAAARSGGRETVEALIDVYHTACLPPRSGDVAPSTAPPAPPPRARLTSAVDRHEVFRQVTEAIAALDPYAAFTVACDFYMQEPAMLDLPRPGAHRVEIARGLPLPLALSSGSINEGCKYHHVPSGVERLTGREFLASLASRAKDETAAPLTIHLATARVLSSRPVPVRPAEWADLPFDEAADQVLESRMNSAAPWWRGTDPDEIIAACAAVLAADAKAKSPTGSQPPNLSRAAALHHLMGTAALGALDVARAQLEFKEVDRLMAELQKVGGPGVKREAASEKAAVEPRTAAVGIAKGKVSTKKKAEKATTDDYVQWINSGVAVPFMPRPLKRPEAIALAYLLDRSNDASQALPNLEVLAGSEALQGTSYSDGISALRELSQRPSLQVTAAGGLAPTEEALSLILRVLDSGLVPNPALPMGDGADRGFTARVRRLAGVTGGLGVGGGVGIRIPFQPPVTPQTPAKPAEWVYAEDAMSWALLVFADPLGATEWAYTGWAIRQSPESLSLPEPAPVGTARPKRPVFPPRPVPAAGATAAPLMGSLGAVDRVRTLHRYPDDAAADADLTVHYPAENDRGVRAALRGDFAASREEFTKAIAAAARARLDLRRALRGQSGVSRPEDAAPAWSLSAGEGRHVASPAAGRAEAHIGLAAQKNLAILDILQGDYDEALSLYHRVLEVEVRQGALPHRDTLFRPLDLEARFALEAAPLRDAARDLLAASAALEERRPADALDVLDALPVQFGETRAALRLRLTAQLLRLTGLQAPGDDKALLVSALKECERTAVKLDQKPLQGAPQFAHDPKLLLLRADIGRRLNELAVGGAPQPPGTLDDRRKAGLLLEEGLEQATKLLTSDKPVTREDCPEWLMAYLEAAPGILAQHGDLFQPTEGKPAPCPKAVALYSALVASCCGDKFDSFRTSLVLRPLAQNAYPGLETLLSQALPADPAKIEALGSPDGSGVSRLDWLLAAMLRAAGTSNQTLVHARLKDACRSVAQAGDAYASLVDATTALEPAMGTRIALERLASLPTDNPAEAEAVLARRSSVTLRRLGVLAKPAEADHVSDSWYRDSDAFWYTLGERPRGSFGERLADSIAALSRSPQQFALVHRELEALIRRDRLDAASKAGGVATGRFHASAAETLSGAGTPAALGLLLRYADCGDGRLGAASVKARNHRSYAAVAGAPWLVDEPGYGVWKGQYGPAAWSRLRLDLPPVISLNAPAPNSAFVGYLREAIATAVAGREQDVPRLLQTEEASLSAGVYNDLLAAVIKANGLPLPPIPTGPEPATFAEAIARVRAESLAAYQAERLRRDPAAKPNPVDDKRKADTLVDAELDRFTIELWCVASHYSAEHKSLSGVRLSEVSRIYRKLPLLVRLKDSGRDFTTPSTTEKIKGVFNEGIYPDDLRLKRRRLSISDDLTQAVYEETFERDGTEVVIRGEVPFPYRRSLKQEPHLLDLLDLSLARRAAMLRNPSGPIRLSLDMAFLSPELTWPAMMQDSGARYLNGYLAACTRDLKPRTAQELMAAVAPETLATTNVLARLAQRDIQARSLVTAAFTRYYTSRALERAPEVPDRIEKKLFGFLGYDSFDNGMKRSFVNQAEAHQAAARVVLDELHEQNFFRLCDPGDPPRFVFVTETGLSDDGKDWICTYRIVTALGQQIKFVEGGKVDKLPEICKQLIRTNPGLVKRLRLDLGGLTADPTVQLSLAVRATMAAAEGDDSVISVLDRLGLTAEEMKRLVQGEGSPFVGKQASLFDEKARIYREQGRRMGILDAGEPPVMSPSEYVTMLTKYFADREKAIRVEGKGQADQNIDELKRASEPISVFGVPGLLEVSFQNGKFVSFQVVFAFTGNIDEPKSYTPVLPIDMSDPIGSRDRAEATSRTRPIDPRIGLEKPNLP